MTMTREAEEIIERCNRLNVDLSFQNFLLETPYHFILYIRWGDFI